MKAFEFRRFDPCFFLNVCERPACLGSFEVIPFHSHHIQPRLPGFCRIEQICLGIEGSGGPSGELDAESHIIALP